jgi:hypothetical protein
MTFGRASAWEWQDAPFGLRLGLSLDRASSFTDVVGLSASAAYPYGSSVNPANDDFLRDPPNDFRLVLTGTGLYVPFETGPYITAVAGSVTYRLLTAGAFTFSYSNANSHDAKSSQGDNYRLDSEDFTLGYSHLVEKWLSIGSEFKLTKSTLKLKTNVAGFPVNTETEATGYDVRLGALIAPAKDWLVALMGGAGWNYAGTSGGVAIPALFGGPTPINFDTFTRSINLRAGVGWRPSEKLGAYVDWQILRLWTDDDSVSVGRTFAGVEWLPHPAIALRLGGSVDTAGKSNVSTGIGFYGFKRVQFEFAYVYDAFLEVRREFGAAHLVSSSIIVVAW